MKREPVLGTPYEQHRWARLLKATEHVAPYINGLATHGEQRLIDARHVISSYVKGTLLLLPSDILRRLANDEYGRRRIPMPLRK